MKGTRRTFKEKQADALKKRIVVLEKQLAGYADIKRELDECKAMLHIMGLNDKQQPAAPVAPSANGSQPQGEAAVDNAQGDDSALSKEGIALLCRLPQEFDVNTLTTRLDNNRQKAYNYVASWKRKRFIETIKYGTYRRGEHVVPII
jgi:hypothetical protein